MKFRNTWAVALLFLALGAYLWFFEKPKAEEEAKKKTLLSFPADEVTGVTLTYPESEIVLAKTDQGWRMEKPQAVEADESTVKNLVSAVADAELKRTIEAKDAGSPEAYGLDKPAAVVKLTLKNGSKLPAIRVGKASPVGYSTYVAVEGSTSVKLVPSSFSSGMKKEPKDLRNKTIVDFKDEDVQRVEIAGGDAEIALARDGADWKLEKPAALKADAAEVRNFLSSVRSLRAQDFVDSPSSLGDYGLDAPRRTITLLIGKDNAKKQVLVGAEKEHDGKKDLYVKRAEGDTVYAVGTYAWTNLSKGASTFRDKTVLVFERDALGAVEVARREGESFRLVRSVPAAAATPRASAGATPTATAEKWTLEGAAKSKETKTSQLIGDLHSLKGFEIAAEKPESLSPYGLDNPDVTFSLVDGDGKPIGRVIAAKLPGSGEEDRGKAYAMAEGGDVVYEIRDYVFANLDKKRADLAEAEPTPVPVPTATAASK
jgi:hypothetical protein